MFLPPTTVYGDETSKPKQPSAQVAKLNHMKNGRHRVPGEHGSSSRPANDDKKIEHERPLVVGGFDPGGDADTWKMVDV